MNTELSDKKKTPKAEKKTRAEKDKLLTRILCLVLMVLMVGGMLTSAIYYLITGAMVRTAAVEAADTETIRVGLMYGSGVTVGFETTAPNGFVPGAVASDNSFTPLWQIGESKVSVTVDANLSKSGMTYSKTTSLSPVVGGYHIQTEASFATREEAQTALNAVSADGARLGLQAFACYINGAYRIRVGQFANTASATSTLSAYGSVLAGYACSVVSPTNTAVSVVNPNTDQILFEYDCGKTSHLGLSPVQSGGETAYLKTPATNTYCGVFEYSRYINGNTDGVALTNIVTLDEYVMGVLPYEIGNTWPLEAQKTFAIAARSYALANLNKHSAYSFDMCNGTECQMYLGMKSVNDTVREAVSSTSGLVVAYGGKIVSTYFSAVTGGSTVSAKEAWGGSTTPYIVSVATPWENYSSHKYGEWTDEYSPTELYQRIVSKLSANYPSLYKNFRLRDRIESITVNSYAENSQYVYSLTLHDPYGNSFTLEKTDTIRRAIGLLSANFVVGRGGESVQTFTFEPSEGSSASQASASAASSAPVYNVHSSQQNNSLYAPLPGSGMSSAPSSSSSALIAPSAEGVCIITADGRLDFQLGESINVVKSIGSTVELNLSNLSVLDAGGLKQYDMIGEYYDAIGSMIIAPDAPPITGSGTDYSKVTYKKVYSTVVLPGSPSNFVFHGKGYGHGVGMSQIGARDLAYNGYTYDRIIAAYFPSTTVVDYRTLR